MSSRSTCSAAASPAKTSASPAREPESTEHARVFGANTRVLLASFDPATSSWRTSQLSLLKDSGECLETWPRSGMTRSGTAFLLRPLAPLTGEIDSGLLPTPMAADGSRGSRTFKRGNLTLRGAAEAWPTPNAADGKGGRKTPDEDLISGRRKSGAKVQVSLRDAVRRSELIPTPTRGDAKSAANATANRRNPDSKHHSGTTLTDFVRMWPTPTHRLGTARGPQAARYTDPRRSNDLDDAVAHAESFKTQTSAPFSHGGSGGELHKQVAPSGGPLNPQWVAWLMGFPIDWTSLPHSGTRSSRRSRSGSAGESSTTSGA